MFSLLKLVLCYTKIIVITPEEHDKVVNLKVSDTELKFLTISSQKQSAGSVLPESLLKNFVKLTVEKPCRTRT